MVNTYQLSVLVQSTSYEMSRAYCTFRADMQFCHIKRKMKDTVPKFIVLTAIILPFSKVINRFQGFGKPNEFLLCLVTITAALKYSCVYYFSNL